MKAVILAAGRGSRLKGYTKNTPKPLVEINGKPLLQYLLDALEVSGVKDVVLITGYLSERIERYLNNKYQLIMNNCYQQTNSIYSLWLARDLLYNEKFILLNADLVITDDCIRKLIESDFDTASLVKDTSTLKDGEMNVRIENNSIVQISKELKSKDAHAESAQITMFSAEDSVRLFDRIDEIVAAGETDKFPAHAYDRIIEESCVRPVYINEEDCFEIDTVSDLLECREYFKAV